MRTSAAVFAFVCVLFAPLAHAQDALVDDAAPDGSEDAAAATGAQHEQHPDRYAIDVDAPPDAVVRKLIDAAVKNDEIGYTSQLSRRFVEGVRILRLQPGAEGVEAWRWSVFMGATAATNVTEIDVKQFYERANVRVTTADGRRLKFRLVVEDNAWRVDLPEPLEALIASRLPPPPPEPEDVDDDAETPAAPALAPTPEAPPVAALEPPKDIQPPVVVPPPPDKPQPVEPGFFQPGGPGHYVWYLPDYAAVGVSLLGVAASVTQGIAPPWILIGPDYQPSKPETSFGLLDERLDLSIGQPMVQQKVPEYAIGLAGVTALGVLTAMDIARHLEFHQTHAFVLGAIETIAFTLAATEALKLGVGRLRPDFRERYVRAACGGYVEAPSTFDCSIAPDDGFVVTRSDVVDGMKSFPSGHSSTAFALATYFSLYLGGEYLWGKQARFWTMPIAALAMGVMVTAAGFVAASRLSDNRHHVEDVIVGAGLGTTIAAGTYFMHFGTDGHARWRQLRFTAAPLADGGGAAAVSGTW